MPSLSELVTDTVQSAGASGGTVNMVASGNISTGQTVVLNSNGTVSLVNMVTVNATNSTLTSAPSGLGTEDTGMDALFDPTSGKIILAGYAGISNSVSCWVGTLSGDTITFGGRIDLGVGGICRRLTLAIKSSTSTLMVLAAAGTNFMATAGTISGTNITFGSGVSLEVGTSDGNGYHDLLYHPGADRFFAFYSNRYVGLTVSGTTVTRGVQGTSPSTDGQPMMARIYPGTDQKIVLLNARATVTAFAATVSGGTLTFGNGFEVEPGATSAGATANQYQYGKNYSLVADPESGKMVAFWYHHLPTANSAQGVYASILTVAADNSITGTTATKILPDTGNIWVLYAVYDSFYKDIIVAYRPFNTGGMTVHSIKVLNGTSLTRDSSSVSPYPDQSIYGALIFDSVNNKSIFFNRVRWSATQYTTIVPEYSTTTASSWLGIAASNAANTQTATISVMGSVAGGLANLVPGTVYYVSSNGALTSNATSTFGKIGKALTSTTLLITNGNA